MIPAKQYLVIWVNYEPYHLVRMQFEEEIVMIVV